MDVLSLVAKLSLDSSDYESGLNRAESSANSFGGKISSGLGGITKAASAAVAGATAVAVGFGKSAVEAGMSFDSAMSQVAATMGLSMEEMETQVGSTETSFGHFEGTLRDFAMYMGGNTAFSATQAAEALNYMALAGYDAETSMKMLPNVLSLAAAGGFDLARASDMVTDVQTAFGISLDRTSLMVDEMAKAASTGNTSVEQLGDAFLVVGGLAQELNGGIVSLSDGTSVGVDGVQELEIALTAMANAGIKGSEAGTHMRNMLLKLSSPTDDGANALRNLGVEIFDTEGNMRSLKDIFQDMSNTMNGNVGPALENFYAKFAGMSEEHILKEFEKSPEDFEFLGTTIVDSTGKLRDFNEVFNELKDGISQESKIQLIADMFNARDIASAESLLNAIEQDWDRIGESILDADGAAAEMADTQLDNLAGDITIFNSALEKSQIALSDKLTPTLRLFTQTATESLGVVTEKLNEYFSSDQMQDKMQSVADALTKVIDAIVNNLDPILDGIIGLINGVATAVAFLADHFETITTVVEMAVAAFAGLKAVSIVETIMGFVGAMSTAITTAGSLGAAIGAVVNPVGLVVAAIAAAAVLIVKHWDDIKAAWGKAVEFFSGLVGGIQEAFAPVADFLGNVFSSAWDGIKGVWGNVTGFFGDVIQNIIGVFTNLPKTFLDIGRNIMEGLGNGLLNALGSVVDKAKSVAGSILGAVKGFFGIHSPSSVMREEVGQNIGKGAVLGLQDELSAATKASNDFSNALYDGLETEVPAVNVGYAQPTQNNARMETIMLQILDAIQKMGITIDGKAIVGYMAPEMNRALGELYYNTMREVSYA